MRLLIINGPNLNLLGTREPDIYGSATLADLETNWHTRAAMIGASIEAYQSNHEGAIVDAINEAPARFQALIINAGALTHYSYAVRDAIEASGLPTVEVHISNIYEREDWRHHSVLTDVSDLTIVGRGTDGYLHAIDHLVALSERPPITATYGNHSDAVVDVRTPQGEGPFPVALLIHGGFWGTVWKRDLMDPMSVALCDTGWATVNAEYTRGTGSYATAPTDLQAVVDWIRTHARDHNLDANRIVAIGHSAGGYLALTLAHRGSPIAAALPLAAVSDLEATSTARPDDDPSALFLGARREHAPRLWEQAELRGQPQVPVHMVHGSNDETVRPDQSETYAQLHDVATPVTIIDGCDHMAIIDPHSAAWSSVLDALSSVSS